jgi:hypothetical protein
VGVEGGGGGGALVATTAADNGGLIMTEDVEKNGFCVFSILMSQGGRLSGRPNCSRRFPSIRFLLQQS